MLEKIANYLRTNKSIIEKEELNPIVDFINSNSFKSSRIFSDNALAAVVCHIQGASLSHSCADRLCCYIAAQYSFSQIPSKDERLVFHGEKLRFSSC